MNLEQEQLLSALAKRLYVLNKEIVAQEIRGDKPDQETIEKIIATQVTIKKFLVESGPIDTIRDPFVRDVLIKVREGNYFELDKRDKRLKELFEIYGEEIVTGALRNKGIDVTDEEVEKYLNEIRSDFEKEIVDKIDDLDYFERKDAFGNIITADRLHDKIHQYYPDIRNSFLFGQMYAALGLCRVMIEIAFKDKFKKLMPRVTLFENYSFRNIVETVCKRLNKRDLIKETMGLYKESSEILHADIHSIDLGTARVLNFIHKTFNMIEKLYS